MDQRVEDGWVMGAIGPKLSTKIPSVGAMPLIS
jgi:hypothetical protein